MEMVPNLTPAMVAKLKEQARRLGDFYPHLRVDYDAMVAGDDDVINDVIADTPTASGGFKEMLRQYSYEIRNGAAHRAVEEEMLRNK
jgi:hypothetical protein